jgi:rare lipoprotein A
MKPCEVHSCRRPAAFVVEAALVALLAACASAPPAGAPRPGPAPAAERDGPEAQPPANLAAVPDAEPRIEPVRAGGPNKPYEVFGRDYVPITDDRPLAERGLASWYGRKFHGRRTASGEVYNMYEMTAAHPTLPIPSYARVRNPANGREVVVRINDRGPFHAGRIVDLSYTAALKLDLLRGVAPVELERITPEQIRTGAWRKPLPETQVAAAAPIVLPDPSVVTLPLAPVALAEPPAPPPEPPRRAYTAAGSGWWLQFGAFRDRQGAEAFQRHIATELESLAPMMAIFSEGGLHRLQAGPYAHRADAGKAVAMVRASLQLTPIVVERR